ncbi:MAG: hypothetical protein II809_07490, partial [Bacteroidales bacterium]|nr:hypothetical protein [Bacteroidales bacterium]
MSDTKFPEEVQQTVSDVEEKVKEDMNMNILDYLLKDNDAYKWPSIIEFIDNQEKLKIQKRRVP